MSRDVSVFSKFQHCNIVIEARDLPYVSTPFKRLPSAFVKLKVENIRSRTQIVKSRSPHWDAKFLLCVAM